MDDDRRDWCLARARQQRNRRGEPQLSATFGPEETMRCPGWREGNHGGNLICGAALGRCKPNTRGIIRLAGSGAMMRRLRPLPDLLGEDGRCHSCGSAFEKFLLHFHTPNEATT